MRTFRKIVAELFGYSRREKSASAVLAVLLALIITARASSTLFQRHETFIPLTLPDRVDEEQNSATDEREMFYFDPNTVSYNELIRLGLSDRQASTLINFRSSGAHFLRSVDIGRVYGIDSIMVERLSPWIRIAAVSGQEERRMLTPESLAPAVITKEYNAAIPVIKTELNSCSVTDLEELPGIGKVLAERIVKYRMLLGGYKRVEQLTEVYGLDTVVYLNIYSMVTTDTALAPGIDLDSCSYRELARHPYFGEEAARSIIKYRSLMGRPVTLADLVAQRVISESMAARMALYVCCSTEPDSIE